MQVKPSCWMQHLFAIQKRCKTLAVLLDLLCSRLMGSAQLQTRYADLCDDCLT